MENEAQLLTKVGFSASQAKIYLVLAKRGRSTADVIAKNAKMDRAETYRQIGQLEERGFVKRILSYPSEFEPISMYELIPTLLQRKKEELSTLEGEFKQVLQRTLNAETAKKDEKEFIQFIPRLEMVDKEIYKCTLNAETNIDFITTIKYLREAGSEGTSAWADALKKGVKMTMITEKPSKKSPIPKNIRDITRHTNFTVKYLSSTPALGQNYFGLILIV
jgi:sugar-specific transcriptional regulator TrmB